jgi:hypothetical protein
MPIVVERSEAPWWYGLVIVPTSSASSKGTLRSFSKTKGVVRTFCSDCGTSVSYLDEGGISNELYIALGFFDHPENFRPHAHAYWSEKLPWIEFADRLPRIEGYSRGRDPAFGNPHQRT